LFLLAYLFCNHFTAAFINPVSAGAFLGADNSVKSAVNELDGAVVLNRDSDASGLRNHIPEVFSSGDSSGPTVVMGAMYSLYES
jgi:hypothetical protein